jgi:transmembrane sensor
MSAERQPDIETVRERAADWALRLEDEDCGCEERRALATWLAAAPAHREAFEQARRALRDSALAFGAERRAVPTRERVPPPPDAIRSPFRTAASAAAILMILAVAAFIWSGGSARITADVATGSGETPAIRLPDGSVARLNSESSIDIAFDEEMRLIRLLRGQALFEVAKGAGRPFVVEAGVGRIEALGTAFDVNLLGGGVEITVIESRVRVATSAGARELGARDRIAYDGEGALGPAGRTPEGLEAPWRSGRLVFEDRPLKQVAEELGRRLPGRVLALGRALSERRVSGSFDLADPSRALDAMASTLGLRVVRMGPWLTLIL